MERIERLRHMAREALDEYKTGISAGEEPCYPQWAEDMIAVCGLAESVIADSAHLPQRPPVAKRPLYRHVS